MPEPEDARLTPLVEALADGSPVDWPAAEAAAVTDQERLIIRRLGRIGLAASIQRRRAMPATWSHLELVAKVGEGAFGDIFRAHDPRLARDVALKLLHEPMTTDGTRASAVIEEGRLLARVRHPNVVTVYGAECLNGQVGIWTEFIEGHTLQAIVAERGPLPVEEVTAIGLDLCRALTAVHGAGLLHRDIKAQNVMREDGGRIVLMDFGTGRETAPLPGRTSDVSGTPLYLAPEIFEGSSASVRSDIYSLGVLLYYLATGTYPIKAANLREVQHAHLHGIHMPLQQAGPSLPRLFVEAVERASSPDAESRFADAGAMAVALTNAAAVGQAAPTTHAAGMPGPGRWFRRPLAVWATTLAAAAILVTAAGMYWSRSAPSFQARDWVFVARFENLTDDASLDGSIESAIARDLSTSQFVNVVPPERIADALRLMKKPLDARLDADLAKEICLRDGEIKALLTGRVEKVGSSYVLTATLIDPVRNATVGHLSEPGVSRSEVPVKTRELSSRVRETLGESVPAIERSNQELAKVATPSLPALTLYTEATRLLSQMTTDTNRTIYLLERALREDPGFASAYTMLALALQDARRPQLEYLAMAKRGFDLSATASERERYLIEAIYFRLSGQFPAALASYEALTQRYPDDARGVSDLRSLYGRLRNPDAAQALTLRYADLRPRDVSANAEAAFVYGRRGALREEEEYVNRAALAGPGDGPASWHAAAWVQLTPIRKAWLADRTQETVAELKRAEEASSQPDNPLHNNPMLPFQLGWAYATLGQMNEASGRFAEIRDAEYAGWRDIAETSLAFLRGDTKALRERLQRYVANPYQSFILTSLLIRAGFVPEAAERTKEIDPFGGAGLPASILQGDLALAMNDTAFGISTLESALPKPGNGGHPMIFMATESLASVYENQGNLVGSIRILEQLSKERASLWRPTGALYAPFWLRTQAQLARVYRKAGRVEEARAIEAQLRTLLASADADHPILLALKQTDQTSGVASAGRGR